MSVTIEDLEARLSEIEAELQEINQQYAGQRFSQDAKQKWNDLVKEREEKTATVEEIRARLDYLRKSAGDESRSEPGAEFNVKRQKATDNIWDLAQVRQLSTGPEDEGRLLRDNALRAVENAVIEEVDEHTDAARSKANVERLLRNTDTPHGLFARYILSVGSPTYKRAFTKWLSTRDATLMDRQEQSTWAAGQMAQRAMSLTGSAGGFAVPFELDPTILNTSNGVVNPIRAISRVRQITVDEWRGVSSAGITASYVAEATEATDNSPTLTQPTVSTERAHAFVPFSIEIGMDWSSIQGDLTELFRDAKDELEAGKFISGTGTNEPFGVLTGTTNTVAAATGLTITLANLYSLKNALPPRYRANGVYLADAAILDRFRQFDTVGSSAAIWVDTLQDGIPARLLGRPVYEASEMAETITNGTKVALYGDFSRYLIVDRVGLTVDFIPHLMGANRRPTGERGLYAYWRNGAKVLDANAFRALTGTT